MNGDPSNKKNQFIYTLFYSVLVVLTAQINVHLFTRNFVASAGVIVFALLMLLLDEFAAMPVMFLSATGVMVTRSIAGAGKVLTSAEIWKTGMPEFVFYIVFGVVIYLLYNYVYSEERSWTLFIVLFVPDFAANLAELYIRIGSEMGNAFTICALLLIALVSAEAGDVDEGLADAAETARGLYRKLSASKAPSELTERARALAEDLDSISMK